MLEDYTQEPYTISPYLGVSISPETSWASEDDRRLVCVGVTLNEDLTEVIATVGSIGAE